MSGSETILLVEDEEVVRAVTRMILQKCGYFVLDTGQPAEAIALCHQHRDEIALLITDMILPDISGQELARQLSQFHPKLRVLYISGYADDDLVNVYDDISTQDIHLLEKPFSPDVLKCKVNQILEGDLPSDET